MRDKAASPKPPANATQGKSIGKGKASANTANTPDDSDSIWVEKIDVDGDGNVDEASLLWDDEDKVLYIYKEETFTCSNGGTGSGGMLVAVVRQGQHAHRQPAGLGLVGRRGSTRASAPPRPPGIYGCKFDAAGKTDGLRHGDRGRQDRHPRDRHRLEIDPPPTRQHRAPRIAGPFPCPARCRRPAVYCAPCS